MAPVLSAPLMLATLLVLFARLLLRFFATPLSLAITGSCSGMTRGGPAAGTREGGLEPSGMTGGQEALPGLCIVSALFLPRPMQIGQEGLDLQSLAR